MSETREPGFYWVRRERWEVAEWVIEPPWPSRWLVTTSKFSLGDEHLIEIDERPIQREREG
jgi:hypothetical protein